MPRTVKPLNRTETQQLADTLRRLLDLVTTGDLVVPTATLHRLHGALVGVETVLGTSSPDLLADLLPDDETDLDDRPAGPTSPLSYD